MKMFSFFRIKGVYLVKYWNFSKFTRFLEIMK